MEMAAVGGTPDGGCSRLALTDADKQGLDVFAGWARAEGCAIARDRIGNVFAERPGQDPALPAVVVGSHLDTQPNGGKFDGAYGVLAGLEIVRTLNDHDVATRAPLLVASWSNEEGARFPHATTGSSVFSGALDLDAAFDQRSPEGARFEDELGRLGLAGSEEVGGREIAAYFELHIEQGPVLESTRTTIGVVTRGQGVRGLELAIGGIEGHAGTVPLDARRDPLIGAAEIVLETRARAQRVPGALATVGRLSLEPNSRAVIPGRVTMVVDLRHVDVATLDELEDDVRRLAEETTTRLGLGLEATTFLRVDPVQFDEASADSIRKVARRLDIPFADVVSGAVHDATRLESVAPTALVFVPCRDGVSHNPAEHADLRDLQAGCDVVLQAALDRAGVAHERSS